MHVPRTEAEHVIKHATSQKKKNSINIHNDAK